MRNEWYPVLFSTELEPGAVHGMQLCGQSVALFRKVSGQVGALHDVCPHRSAPLSLGKVHGGHLACPYHGWRLDAAGAVQHIPTLREDERVPEKACTPRVAVREHQGMIWLYAGEADAAPETATMSCMEETLYGDAGWDPIEMRYDLDVHHTLLTENLLDPAHLNFVHAGTVAREEDAGPLEVELKPEPDGFLFTHRNPQRSHHEPSRSAIGAEASGAVKEGSHTRFVAPGGVRIDFSIGPDMAFSQVSYSIPTAPDAVRMLFRAYRNFAVGDLEASTRTLAHSRVTFEQDLGILEGLSRNLRHGYPAYANPVREDRGCLAFRRWFDALPEALRA